MINKLKFLSAYFTRQVVPANGNAIGKVFYTYKYPNNGRTLQYVINLDTKIITKQTIDSVGNPLLSPNPVVVFTRTAPSLDKALYTVINDGTIYDKFPVLTYVGDLVIDMDYGVETVVNIFNNSRINDVVPNPGDIGITITNGTPLGFAWDFGTFELTMSDTLAIGTYTRTFMIYSNTEYSLPPVNISITINVI